MINWCERSLVRERKFHFDKFMQILLGCEFWSIIVDFPPIQTPPKIVRRRSLTPVDDHAISLNRLILWRKVLLNHIVERRLRQRRMGSIQIYDKNLAIAADEKVTSLIHLVAASPLLSLCTRRWFIVARDCRRHCLSACHNSDSHNSMCFIRVISESKVFTAREAVLNDCLSIIPPDEN